MACKRKMRRRWRWLSTSGGSTSPPGSVTEKWQPESHDQGSMSPGVALQRGVWTGAVCVNLHCNSLTCLLRTLLNLLLCLKLRIFTWPRKPCFSVQSHLTPCSSLHHCPSAWRAALPLHSVPRAGPPDKSLLGPTPRQIPGAYPHRTCTRPAHRCIINIFFFKK